MGGGRREEGEDPLTFLPLPPFFPECFLSVSPIRSLFAKGNFFSLLTLSVSVGSAKFANSEKVTTRYFQTFVTSFQNKTEGIIRLVISMLRARPDGFCFSDLSISPEKKKRERQFIRHLVSPFKWPLPAVVLPRGKRGKKGVAWKKNSLPLEGLPTF